VFGEAEALEEGRVVGERGLAREFRDEDENVNRKPTAQWVVVEQDGAADAAGE